MTKMNKTQVYALNELAHKDFDKAQAMLDGINMVLGTEYGWLNRRVVEFKNPNGSTVEKYADCRDAWVHAEE